jgi:hypothetical protein
MHFSRQSLEASTTNEDLESVWKYGLTRVLKKFEFFFVKI